MTRKAYIVTGPTSGIGRRAALELAAHGTIVLVGRSPEKLAAMRRTIEGRGGRAVSLVCDLSEPASVARAAAEIAALDLPTAGLLNNAGIMEMRPTRNSLGWDMTFATDHLGPFALTEALIPHFADGTKILFVASAVENPERQPAKRFGFRGSRFISVEAGARGDWEPGGSTLAGADAYATSKQCTLATALAFARENPHLRINAVEPGVTPATSLGHRDASAFARIMAKILIPLLVPLLKPFVKVLSTPKRAGRVLAGILTDGSGKTGIYYDESGHPMRGSDLVHGAEFQDRVVAETRAFLRLSAAP